MPSEGIVFANRSDILSFEEILRLISIFRNLGVEKIRITGGEPFVRNDMDKLLMSISKLIPNVHITTNATLLHRHFDQLKNIKVKSLNVSLDTLDKEKFERITRRDSFENVLNNIKLSLDHDFNVKLNVVIMKGINDDEIIDFVRYGIENGTEIRFIEAMPFNDFDGNKQLFLSFEGILDIIRREFPKIQPVDSLKPSSSQKFLIDDSHTIGIIPAYSRLLCGSCNRIRLTAKGEMMTCLYAEKGLNLLQMVRNPEVTDEHITEMIKFTIANKEKDGFIEEKKRSETVFRSMTTIGG